MIHTRVRCGRSDVVQSDVVGFSLIQSHAISCGPIQFASLSSSHSVRLSQSHSVRLFHSHVDGHDEVDGLIRSVRTSDSAHVLRCTEFEFRTAEQIASEFRTISHATSCYIEVKKKSELRSLMWSSERVRTKISCSNVR